MKFFFYCNRPVCSLSRNLDPSFWKASFESSTPLSRKLFRRHCLSGGFTLRFPLGFHLVEVRSTNQEGNVFLPEIVFFRSFPGPFYGYPSQESPPKLTLPLFRAGGLFSQRGPLFPQLVSSALPARFFFFLIFSLFQCGTALFFSCHASCSPAPPPLAQRGPVLRSRLPLRNMFSLILRSTARSHCLFSLHRSRFMDHSPLGREGLNIKMAPLPRSCPSLRPPLMFFTYSLFFPSG